MVVGGTVMDITSTFNRDTWVDINAPSTFLHTSCQGVVRQSLGGVGRNVAEAAFRAGAQTVLVSAVGNDLAANVMMDRLERIGMRSEGIHIYDGETTAIYNALHAPDGQLISAVADMNVFKRITVSQVMEAVKSYSPSLICCDGNLEPPVLSETARIADKLNIPVHFEPTSVPKSLKVFHDPATVLAGCFKSISPNQHELVAMSNAALKALPVIEDKLMTDKITQDQLQRLPNIAKDCLPYAFHLSHYFRAIITKLGDHGCLVTGQSNGRPIFHYFEAHKIPGQIKSVTGAGDSFVGVFLAQINDKLHCLEQLDSPCWPDIIYQSQNAAIRTLQSHDAVAA